MDQIVDVMGGRIIEMAVEGSDTFNIPNDPRIDLQELTKDDPNPMFVNVEVLRSGISGNRREYTDPIVEQIGPMIPGTIGYLGHPDPQKTGFEFRDPQSIYVGSKVEDLPGGGKRVIGKSYLFKNSPLREWIPKSIIARNPLTVSINGIGNAVRDLANKLIHVQSINKLDSIDWANPGTEGVGSARAINIVSEMKDNEGGDNMADVVTKTPELIRSISIAEMRAYNEDAVNALIKGISITELQDKNPELVKTIIEQNKITEMQLTVDGQAKAVKLTEVQGLLDGKDNKITELQNAANKSKLDAYTTQKITEQVPEQYREKIAKRVVGNTEAEIDTSIAAEVSYLKEMIGAEGFDNMPKGNPQHKDNDDMKQKVMSLFGVEQPKK